MATGPGGSPLGANPALTAGEKVKLTAGGFVAGEKVGITLHSATKSLGSVKAGSTGRIAYTFVVPAGLSGSHRVVFAGASSSKTFAFVVPAVDPPSGATANAADVLAHTGANVFSTVGLALLLMVFGAGVLGLTRRQIVTPRGRHR